MTAATDPRLNDFAACEICGASTWRPVHAKPVRDGVFGASRDDGLVAECEACGVQRLAEACCPDPGFYETEAYRAKLQAGLESDSYFAAHDELQLFSHQVLWPYSVRGKVVADVGCAGGSFLDTVRGQAATAIGIEPYQVYRDALQARGIAAYDYATSALADYGGGVDLATSFQVIEHVDDPVAFLADIGRLLKPDGRVLISTPNRDDILMKLLPDEFPSFFYRVVHRWYFDAASLGRLAERSGLRVEEVRYVHRFGMSNALAWLRDRAPKGRLRLDGIDATADGLWKSYLEGSGQSDTLCAWLSAA